MTYDAIIIGGGLSGLSAAVELTARGKKILLLEQRPFLGGRAYSFVDETTGDVVDNGQHLLMGCYHATRRYLKLIGSDHFATLQPDLHIDFLHPQRGVASLSCPSLPSPLHVLMGLLRMQSLSLRDRLKLLRVGAAVLFHSSTAERRLQNMTVDKWLTSLGQTEFNKKYLWDIIAIGTLNDDPKTVSALLFARVLRAAFAGSREDSSLLVPRVGLSELFVDPAVRFLKSYGADIRTNCGVKTIKADGNTARGVQCEDDTTLTANAYISAVPYYALQPMLQNSGVQMFPQLPRFESSPIVTIHLWLDKPVMDQEFAALLDLRVQWVFNKSKMLARKASQNRQYLSLVISGAAEYVAMEKEQLVAMALEDLCSVFPLAASANVLHSLVVKEKRATFSPTPSVEPLRPLTRTALRNLFLTGDWTDTGLPATIEGAILSGRKAAELVSSYPSGTNS
ncbi:MAG: hydroxysqualene dehydroxylase HpnE [Ignavibacteriae bacterium]|nr:hydroxysqualene dehydroxylase HpnE [Ignavibacteriota bacterium]